MEDPNKPLGAPEHFSDPQTESSQPIPPKRKLNWNRFFLGVIAVIIIEFVAINLLRSGDPEIPIQPPTEPTKAQPSPTSNTTANWKVHRNEQLGVEFKYPQTYAINEKADGSIGIASSEAEFNEMGRFIVIRYSNKKYEDTVADVIKSSDLMKRRGDTQDIVETNDKKTTQTTGPYNSVEAKDLYTKTIFWKYRTGALMVFYTNVNKKEVSVYDQIISTITFTEDQITKPPVQ